MSQGAPLVTRVERRLPALSSRAGTGRRSLAETAISRYKTVIGRGLCARTLLAQKTETKVGGSVLNRMTWLGMPVSQRIAGK